MPDTGDTPTPSESHRLNIALSTEARDAMTTLRQNTGCSKTEIINRALKVYSFVDNAIAGGGNILVECDGKIAKVEFIF